MLHGDLIITFARWHNRQVLLLMIVHMYSMYGHHLRIAKYR